MIRRLLVVVAIVAVSAAGWWGRQPLPATEVGVGLEPAVVPAVACGATVDRTTGGVLALASSLANDVPVIASASGAESETIEVEVDNAGGGAVPLGELIPGGTASLLVEFDLVEAAAALVQTSESGLGAVRCTRPATSTVLIPGASTRNAEALELRLANPYAVDAVVSITSASEGGIDSASELDSVIVPARSIVTRDLAALLPLRQTLSLTVTVESGAVHAFAVQGGQGDRMLLEGVEPGTEWWLPIPEVSGAETMTVEIATPAPLEVEIEVDVYGPEGVTEAAVSDFVPAEALLEIPLAELGEGARGVRVRASGPVVASLVAEGEGVRAGSPGIDRLAGEWLVAGVNNAPSGALWLLNPGELPAEVYVQPLTPGATGRTLTVDPQSLRSVAVEPAGSGYLIRSSTQLAVMGVVAGERGVGMVTGTPIASGFDEF